MFNAHFLLTYRTAALFLTLFLLSAMLPTSAQDHDEVRKRRITLQATNQPIGQVLDTLSVKANVQFFFNHAQVKTSPRVTVNFRNEPLERVLGDLFSDQQIDVVFQNNRLILLRPKKTSERPPTGIPMFRIQGTVVDANTKIPLPRTAVTLSNNRAAGILTDETGAFGIDVPEGTPALLLSHMGYNEESVRITGDASGLVIQLTPATVALEDVVITGMAPRKSESFTGSHLTVKGEDLIKLNPNNLLQALQFFDPSFRIVQDNSRGSDPNLMPEFKLRGDAQLGSVAPSDLQMLMGDYSNRPNMPLLILDGFESSLQRIVDLDPERVETITILKDAAATAIYGSRAANGVIVFETKKPLPGALNIAYSMNFGVYAPDLRDYNLMNASEKLEYERRAGLFPDNHIPQLNYYNHYLAEILRGVDTYWLSSPVQTGLTHRHTLSLQGGDQALRYNFNLNYGDQPGVIKESGRNSMGLSLDLQYRKRAWNISNQLSISDATGRNSPYGSFSQYSRMNPYYRRYDSQGNFTKYIESKFLASGQQLELIFNPLYNTAFSHKNFNKNFAVTENVTVEWAPVENLRWTTNATFTKGMARSENFISRNNTVFEFEDDLTKRGSYAKNTGEMFSWGVNTSLSHNLTRGAHVLSSFARWDVAESTNNAVNLLATGFPNDGMTDFLFGFEMNQRPSGAETTTRTMGMIGQVSYMYDFRYAADFSVRGDISSQFGAETGMAPFWATGVRWNIDRERWMPHSIFNSLVLRASMGVTGSQNYSPYQAVETYSFADLMLPYPSSDVLGAELRGIGNPSLGWSTTRDRTVSLEFSVLQSRLSGGVSYYNNYTDDLLLDYTLAPSTGFETMTLNAGAVQNKGMDFQVSFIPIADYANRFQWVISANAAHNRNTIKRISNVLKKMNEANLQRTDAPLPIYEEGKSTTQLFTVRSLGIDPATGQEVYLKRNGQKTFIWNPADKIAVGDTEPTVRGAVTTSVNYKNFSLSGAFQYEFGGYRYNATLVDKLENTSIAYNLDRRALDGRWSEDNRHAAYKSISILGSATPQSSRFVQKHNEVVFSSLALGYRFDPKDFAFMRRHHMSSFGLNFSMQDILRFSSVEQERGLDYPFARSFNLSLSFLFN